MSESASANPSFDFCRSCGTHYRGRAKEFLPVKTPFMRDPEEGAICVLAQCLCGSRIPVKVAAGPYYFIGRIWRDTRWTTIIVQYVRQVQRGDGKATGYVLFSRGLPIRAPVQDPETLLSIAVADVFQIIEASAKVCGTTDFDATERELFPLFGGSMDASVFGSVVQTVVSRVMAEAMQQVSNSSPEPRPLPAASPVGSGEGPGTSGS